MHFPTVVIRPVYQLLTLTFQSHNIEDLTWTHHFTSWLTNYALCQRGFGGWVQACRLTCTTQITDQQKYNEKGTVGTRQKKHKLMNIKCSCMQLLGGFKLFSPKKLNLLWLCWNSNAQDSVKFGKILSTKFWGTHFVGIFGTPYSWGSKCFFIPIPSHGLKIFAEVLYD